MFDTMCNGWSTTDPTIRKKYCLISIVAVFFIAFICAVVSVIVTAVVVLQVRDKAVETAVLAVMWVAVFPTTIVSSAVVAGVLWKKRNSLFDP